VQFVGLAGKSMPAHFMREAAIDTDRPVSLGPLYRSSGQSAEGEISVRKAALASDHFSQKNDLARGALDD
jgi:hypothetical protein